MFRFVTRTVALTAMLFSGAFAAASTFVALTADEMVAQAETVVQGRVLSQLARWDADGRIIVTESRILVNDVVVGSAPQIVTVQTPGGEVEDTYVEAAGFPKLQRGQEVILFLKRGDGVHRVLGHQQGHFEVVTRDDGVTLAVPQIDDDAVMLTRSGQRVPAASSVELSRFKANLRARASRVRS